jgi:carbon storage regulator
MLIRTRCPQEAVLIGHDIEVRVISTHGSQVRLGIKAPDGVAVLREELLGKLSLQSNEPFTS